MYDHRIHTHFDRLEAKNSMFEHSKEHMPSPTVKKEYVLYWMQQSQRVEYNHALSYAVECANSSNLPLIVFFSIAPTYPEANERHYYFMFEGLVELEAKLKALEIGCIFRVGDPKESIDFLLTKAHTLVMDRGYLRHQRQWRLDVSAKAKEAGVLACFEVESDVIVPVDVASNKEEYMARTLRPKIERAILQYAHRVTIPTLINTTKHPLVTQSIDISDFETLISELPIDKSIKKSPIYRGGSTAGSALMDQFLCEKLSKYSNSNDPGFDYVSKMSMYLHFGQLSSLQIYFYVQDFKKNNSVDDESVSSYLEQLIVRRELAINYVYYRLGYDRFETMTNPWAYLTMALHEADSREYSYDVTDLISYNTHDPYFNAAMREMIETGYMHGYMRMYWCKKIIEWSKDYKSAYETAMSLNNKYFIDGRDPNSYVGVAWCFGLHDQGFKERQVFGKLRYMSANGLKSKFHMKQYMDNC